MPLRRALWQSPRAKRQTPRHVITPAHHHHGRARCPPRGAGEPARDILPAVETDDPEVRELLEAIDHLLDAMRRLAMLTERLAVRASLAPDEAHKVRREIETTRPRRSTRSDAHAPPTALAPDVRHFPVT